MQFHEISKRQLLGPAIRRQVVLAGEDKLEPQLQAADYLALFGLKSNIKKAEYLTRA